MAERIKNLTTEKLHLFWTDAFSQWFPSRFTSPEGINFTCAEQYMMYKKSMLFGDVVTAQKILATEDPKEQKNLGRSVKNFDPVIWDAQTRDIVYQGNYYKFTQNPELWREMEKTRGKELVEASPYDTIWGIGLQADDPDAQKKSQWKGKNWLGETLTKLREYLFSVHFSPTSSRKRKPPTP